MPYRGDKTLDSLLRAARIDRSADQIRDLVRGVLAAPEPLDGDAWMAMVGAPLDAGLRAELRALKTELAGQPFGPAAPVATADRLAALRARLSADGLSGFFVPHDDEYRNEYLPARAERLAFATGFTGSAGSAVVTLDKAALFADGRYTLQARDQSPAALFDHKDIPADSPLDWAAANLKSGDRIGYDPWLHSAGWVEAATKRLSAAGITLAPVASNPLDAVWTDQPPAPLSPFVVQPAQYAGRDSADKRAALAKAAGKPVLLTRPDSIAWLLNIRGGDVPHTPLPLSYAILEADGRVQLFCDMRKLTPEVAAALGPDVDVAPLAAITPALAALGAAKAAVRVEKDSAPAALVNALAGAEIENAADPCQLPKAIKTAAELEGSRAAHIRDGVAVTRFLAWLDTAAAKGGLTEIGASDKLFAFRAEGALFKDTSFDTIAGSGPNGAIVHYRAMPESDRTLGRDEIFLLDSGAQYQDGTTDITRTVILGTPSPEMKDRYTRVLKGHIAVDAAKFPPGTTGAALDPLARSALWAAGLDFAHGTGHGVGSYLSVHEGPQGIHRRTTQVLEAGMIVSNEPGYYKTGAYGIRIENLVAVTAPQPVPGGESPMMGMETLTLVPFDLALVDKALLTRDETAWLDAYHARVRATLMPLIKDTMPDAAATRAWLTRATVPVDQYQPKTGHKPKL